MQRTARMKRELSILAENPPFGISCWNKDDRLDHLEAQIVGSDGTPYTGGIFMLDITIPDRYPFEPPKIQFRTPIYHPNVDTAGRICLDSLKMPPKGAWKPSLNISTLLTTIQLLMAEPNPDDPLMVDIAPDNEKLPYQPTKNEDSATVVNGEYRTPSSENDTSQQASGQCKDGSVKRSSAEVQQRNSPLLDNSNKKMKL